VLVDPATERMIVIRNPPRKQQQQITTFTQCTVAAQNECILSRKLWEGSIHSF